MNRKSIVTGTVALLAVISTLVAVVLGMYCLRLRDELCAHHLAFDASLDEPELVDATKARAMTITSAVEAYRSDHGAYPRALEDLEPDYLESIPHPVAGEPRWEYAQLEASFSLTFGVQLYAEGDYYRCYSYRSETRDWYADF